MSEGDLSGKIMQETSLIDASAKIASNWIEVYKKQVQTGGFVE